MAEKILTAQEVLIYLHIKYKGDNKKIKEALTERETFNPEEAYEKVEEFRKTHPQIMTMVDEGAGKCIRKISPVPYVTTYEGKLILSDYDDMLAVDDQKFAKALTKHGIRTLFITEGGDVLIRIPEIYGDEVEELLLHFGNRDICLNYLKEVSKNILLTKEEQDEDLLEVFSKRQIKHSTARYYAVPGAPGCLNNQLIKEGARLCDSWSDIVFDEGDPDDPKDEDE